MRLRVDSSQVKRDVNQGLNGVDTRSSGNNAGKNFGESFAQSASKNISLKKALITSAVVGLLATGPAGIALGAAVAGVGIAAALVGGIIKSIHTQQKTVQTELAKLLKVKNPSADQKQQIADLTKQLALLNQQAKVYGAVTSAASALKNTLISTLTVSLANSGIIKAFATALTSLGSWIQSHRALFTAFFAAAAPYVPILTKFFEQLVGTLLPQLTGLMVKVQPAVQKVLNAFLLFVKTGVGGFLTQIGAGALSSASAFGGLLVAISPLLPAIGKMAAIVATLLAKYPILIPLILGLAVALKVATLAMAVFTAISEANPIVLIITGIAVAALLIIKYWGPISGFFVRVWGAIYNGFVAPLAHFFTSVIPGIFSSFIGAMRRTLGTWAPIVATLLLGPVAGAAVFIATHWNSVRNTTVAIFSAIGRFFAQIWGSISRTFQVSVAFCGRVLSAAWGAISRTTSSIWNGIGRFFSNLWGAIGRLFSSSTAFCGRVISAAWSGISRTTANIWNGIGRFFSNLWGAIGRLFSSSTAFCGRVIAAAWNGISRTTKNVFNDIGNFFSRFWGNTGRFIHNTVTGIHDDVARIWDAVSKNTKKLWGDIGGWMAAGMKAGIGGLDAVINFVTQKVLNPLITGYNAVNNIWSGGDITYRFPVLSAPKRAGGKIIEGTGEKADDVLVRVSHNETILSAAHSRVLENAGVLGALGVPGFANGGRIPGFATGGQILTDATKFNGHRYVWGGASNPKSGWDCSSFVGYILGHDFSYPLPGGARWNGAVHGPTANQFVNQPGFKMVSHNIKDILPGDLLVENSGGHVGFGVGPNQMFSAYDTASGTLFTNAANMTNILRSTGGPGVYNGPGGTISAAQQKAYNAYHALVTKDAKLYSPAAITRAVELHPAPLPTGVLTAKGAANYKFMGGNVATQIKPAIEAKYAAAVAAMAASGSGPEGNGTTGTEMQNGTQLYNYLLKNLFGGHKIAAAGAIASIWGESTWNPFAQGTGGRGLIGWTPASTISNADFRGGMATQLPAILRFVTSSGDSSTIAQMFQASSVLQAANEWGHGVERFGINDVHSTGLTLAKQIAGLKRGGRVGMAHGGMISEPMIGIGASGQIVDLGEQGRERVIPGDGSDPMLAVLHAILAALHASPAKTAAGVAAAVKAPAATMAQAARAGAR